MSTHHSLRRINRARVLPQSLAASLLGLCLLAAAASAQQDFGQQTPAPPLPNSGQNQPYPQNPPNVGEIPNPAYPQTQNPAPSQSPSNGYGNSTPAQNTGNPLQQLVQAEMQDYGVPPQRELQRTLHGPTPTRIPGGQVITTDRVIALLQNNAQGQAGALVFHVLGPGDRLPRAENAAPASQPGTFDDNTQQEFGKYLQQVTQGDKNRPMIFYCLNTQCWMSYNAALRAINMGFTQVLWYRGGIESWQQAQQMATAMRPQGQSGSSGYPSAPPR